MRVVLLTFIGLPILFSARVSTNEIQRHASIGAMDAWYEKWRIENASRASALSERYRAQRERALAEGKREREEWTAKALPWEAKIEKLRAAETEEKMIT